VTAKKDALRVTSVQIRDVLYAREYAITPGAVTVLSGRNGVGKSTPLKAIQAALGRGSLAKLARVVDDGEEPAEPEVVLVVEGGDKHYRITRSARTVRVQSRVGETSAYEDMPKPQSFLASLVDIDAANPVHFVQGSDKDRVLMLLDAIHVELDLSALLAEAGLTERELPHLPVGAHALEQVEMIRAAIFDRRTGVNRDAKAKAASAEQLAREIPAEIPASPAAEIARLDAECREVAERLAGEEAAVKRGLDAIEREAQAVCRADQQRIRDAAEAALAAFAAKVRAEAEAECHAVGNAATARLAAATREHDASLAEIAVSREATATKREQLARLREEEKAAAAHRALAEQRATFERDAEALAAEAERLTAAIAGIDAYRRRMAEHVPIEGLTIEGATIKVHGIPLDQVNTAQVVGIGVKIAKLRAMRQPLPLVFVDGAESLDSESLAALKAELLAADVQALIGRVEDHELQVSW
jgi:hypothetical protein